MNATLDLFSTSRRVVVADDCAEQRWLVHHMMEPMGFDVVEAANGLELFRALESSRQLPTGTDLLVIADVRMPLHSGLDVLEAWQACDWKYPFVVMTSFPDEDVAQRVHSFGGILLAKPFTLFDLRAVVRRCARLS